MVGDLIYCGHKEENSNNIRSDLEKEFPECKIEREWDDIHGTRLAITVELDSDEFYITILTLGLLPYSLHLGLMMNTDPERFNNLMDKALERMKGGE